MAYKILVVGDPNIQALSNPLVFADGDDAYSYGHILDQLFDSIVDGWSVDTSDERPNATLSDTVSKLLPLWRKVYQP
jgi:hypothetical protein